MTVANHSCVSVTDSPLLVLSCQTLFTLLLASFLSGRRVLSQFGDRWYVWALTVSPLYVIMISTSIFSFSFVSVGTFVVVRNLFPIVTLFAEVSYSIVANPPSSPSCDVKTVFSCLLIAAGVFAYEANDLSFSLVGILLLFSNLVSGVAERILQKHMLTTRPVQVPKSGLVLLNNSAALLFSLPSLLATSHPSPLSLPSNSLLLILSSCILSSGISYSGIWFQTNVTATSFAVTGCGCKLLLIVYGILFEGDSSGPFSILAAFLSLFGVLLYVIPIPTQLSHNRFLHLKDTPSLPPSKETQHTRAEDHSPEKEDDPERG